MTVEIASGGNQEMSRFIRRKLKMVLFVILSFAALC